MDDYRFWIGIRNALPISILLWVLLLHLIGVI